MPFARKFRAMMDLPIIGDSVGDFVVEEIEVVDEGSDWRGYRYAVDMVLRGPGGKEGVRRTLAPLFAQRVKTFSSYGNPYELWFGRPEFESLGDRRYAVRVEGAGARIDLSEELKRFIRHLGEKGQLDEREQAAERAVAAYLEDARVDTKRTVDRYTRRLRRQTKARSGD